MARCLWRSSLGIALLFYAVGTEAAQARIPTFGELRKMHYSSEGRLFDRKGALLQEIRLGESSRAMGWMPLGEMSPALKEAILFVEDRRFLQHEGVDWQAMAGALWQNLVGGGRRGASTITMQLAALLEPALQGKRGLWDKARQANIAWKLEESWSKEEILEAYLNLVTFRGEHVGAAASSRALFDKDPHGLDRKESLLLASLLKAPGMGPEALGARLCQLGKDWEAGLSCEEWKSFAKATLTRPSGIRRRVGLAPHLAWKLLSSGKKEIRSSLEENLQRLAKELLEEQVMALQQQNARDGAVVVLHNATGEVLAYVGSSGKFSRASAVDMVESRRQAGSTLKPFLFAAALEKGYLQPNSWLLDEPFEISVAGRGEYRPENYDRSFHGPVTAAMALGSSLNIPSVRLLDLVGVDLLHGILERHGFTELKPAEDYGASLALGSADVSLLQLANAYRTLANGGTFSPVSFLPGARKKGARVLSPKAARQVSAMLADRESRALTFGWDSLLSTPYPTAVKTGTSKDMRDNWCVGFSSEFTVAVWMGNSGGEPMWQVSGVSGAAPVWRALMDHLHRNTQAKAFPSLSPGETQFQRAEFGRILYPVSGAILAIDPDIPRERQRVAFEVEGEGELFWNEKKITDSLWELQPGKHRFSLRAKGEGKVLDVVSLEVR